MGKKSRGQGRHDSSAVGSSNRLLDCSRENHKAAASAKTATALNVNLS